MPWWFKLYAAFCGLVAIGFLYAGAHFISKYW